METLDWQKLAGIVASDTSKIPYEPNRHLFRKIAFDVFQLRGGPTDTLWILEEGENGESYLVAQYSDDDNPNKTLESKGNWTALADKNGENVTLLYKNTPIRRFASTDFGFTNEDVHIFQDTLINKLTSDASSRDKLLRELNSERLNALFDQFPELA